MRNIEMIGLRNADGNKFIHFEGTEVNRPIRLETFHAARKSGLDGLAAAGVVCTDSKQGDVLLQRIPDIVEFRSAVIAERPGWAKDDFAHLDGTVSLMGAPQEAWATFDAAPACAPAGTIKAWKEAVAGPLGDQPIAAFCLMAAFLPPLVGFLQLHGTIIIELTGPKNTGKSQLQQIVASVYGKPSMRGQGALIKPFRLAVDDVRSWAGGTRHHLMFVDDLDAFNVTATSKASAQAYRAIVYDLGQEASNAVVLTSARTPLRSLIDEVENPSHVITLPTFDTEGYRIFNQRHDGDEGGATLGDASLAAALANHGQVFRRFISKVQSKKLADEGALRRRLLQWRSRFLTRMHNEGIVITDQRHAGYLASIYAAGRLAKSIGLLPKNFQCFNAVKHCLELSQTSPTVTDNVRFKDQLIELCRSGDILRIDKESKKLEKSQKRKMHKAASSVIGVLHNYGSAPELRIPAENITKAFPNWNSIKTKKEVRTLLKMDGRNLCAKAVLAPGMAAARLFCFRIPTDALAETEVLSDPQRDQGALDKSADQDSLFAA